MLAVPRTADPPGHPARPFIRVPNDRTKDYSHGQHRNRQHLRHHHQPDHRRAGAWHRRLRACDELGNDVTISTERGARQFACGDRIMFLRNERELGVKNGTLGTVEEVAPQRMSVRVDDGRSLAFDLKDYAHVDHGYAATIHKAQGMTVDRAHVLATPGMDSHGAYVALSRHRDDVVLHYGRDDFADQSRLVRTLSRERSKDMASDYQRADPEQAFAERRGITFRERVAEIVRKVPEKVRGIFDGLRLPSGRADVPEPAAPDRKVVEDPELELRRARTKALIRHARAIDDIFAAQDAGERWSPAQARELNAARDAFEEVRPHGWRDAE
ncbi:MAG: Ti-type conjugative transfer relaxase TraA, partial [Hyphomonas sp.]|nr:Ti-type conjugative transfer relaxase TraA [Hyphomonas sp.]